MTDYREQAIKDMRSCYNLKDFAVAQREARLRLEAVMREIDRVTIDHVACRLARAALAVKEG